MGLLGIDGVDNCSGFGDDGILLHQPHPEFIQGCQASYPSFLELRRRRERSEYDRQRLRVHRDARHRRLRLRAAARVAAQGAVAVDGPGRDGRHESHHVPRRREGQRHLWPRRHRQPRLPAQRSDAGPVADLDHRRHRRRRLLELQHQHFTPPTYLDPERSARHAAAQPALLLRAQQGGDELYTLERYVNGFKALRPGDENLVIFAAITGVPPDLVTPEKLQDVDFSRPDRARRVLRQHPERPRACRR